MKRYFLFFIAFVLCAKKLPPPSPDRFAPRLIRIQALYDNSLVLYFNEPLDTSSLDIQNFVIYNAQIKLISFFDETQTSIRIITSPLQKGRYKIKGVVKDKSKNQAFFEKVFKSTKKKDTIPPEIRKVIPQTMRVSFPYNITIDISEPIDTSASSLFLLSTIPVYEKKWRKGFTQFKLVVKDTLYKEVPFAFLIFPTLRDFSQNPLEGYYSFLFVADTLLKIEMMPGRVVGVKNKKAIVVVSKKHKFCVSSITDTVGRFRLPIFFKDTMHIVVFIDEDRDLISEAFADTVVKSRKDSLILKIRKKSVRLKEFFDEFLKGR